MGRRKLIENFLSLVSRRKIKGKYVRLDESSNVSLTDLETSNDEVPRNENRENRVTQDFGEKKHFTSFDNYLQPLSGKKETCDVEIYIFSVVFRVHRVVVSKYSSVLSDFFSDLAGLRDPPLRATLHQFRAEVFRVFLEFCYDNVLNVNFDIIEEVMDMVEYLDIPILKEKCLKFLDKMSLEEAIDVLKGKRRTPSSELRKFSISRICKEFSQVNQIERFFELDVSTICKILSNDNLRIASEMEVFRIAWEWINHSMNERRQYISKVMKTVRFPHMTHTELIDCAHTNALTEEYPQLRQIIQDANWVITVKNLQREDPWNILIPAER